VTGPFDPLHRWQAPPVPDRLEVRIREALERTVAAPSSGPAPFVWPLLVYGAVVALLLVLVDGRRAATTRHRQDVPATVLRARPADAVALPTGGGVVVASQVDLREYAAVDRPALRAERRR
jgi:hypothetical protein